MDNGYNKPPKNKNTINKRKLRTGSGLIGRFAGCVGKRLAGKGVAGAEEEVCEETVPISSCSELVASKKNCWVPVCATNVCEEATTPFAFVW